MPKIPIRPTSIPYEGRLIAQGMLREGTPVEDYRERYGLLVKREDLSCPSPGPPFSKTQGVYAHVSSRREQLIGVLDTFHSQAGHAVARACQILGKLCVNYYPVYKAAIRTDKVPGDIPVGSIKILDNGVWTQLRAPQLRSMELGAKLAALPAGRSCILYHQAKKACEERGGYMMPNALKLVESIEETAKEVDHTRYDLRRQYGMESGAPDVVIIPASSGTIAAGVVRGFGPSTEYLIHLGYSRSPGETRKYVLESSGVPDASPTIVDEGYAYKDKAAYGEAPPWPCNEYYDLKAFAWYVLNRERFAGQNVLLWNIG